MVDSPARYCARCGADVRGADAERWVPVARVTNLAELGYFEDRLLDAGIEPRLVDDDNFDALHGVWRGSYAIWVRAKDAAEAADLIETELESGDSEPAHREWTALAGHAAAVSRATPAGSEWMGTNRLGRNGSWPPLVACLIAGGLVYWGGHALVAALRQPAEAGRHSDLARVLQLLDRPLATDADDGGPRVVLRNDRARRSIWLEEDRDGDGRADARLQFRDGRLLESQPR